MTGSLHSAGFIQSGKVLCLIVSLTYQISNCLLETENWHILFKIQDFLMAVVRGDPFQRQHVEHGHHLDKDPPGFKEATCQQWEETAPRQGIVCPLPDQKLLTHPHRTDFPSVS